MLNLSGMITVHQWCECVQKVTGLHLPWRALVPKLATLHEDGKHVLYNENVAVVQVGRVQQQVTTVDQVDKSGICRYCGL